MKKKQKNKQTSRQTVTIRKLPGVGDLEYCSSSLKFAFRHDDVTAPSLAEMLWC